MEDQLGALGLVVNVSVLWNALYMESALQQLRDYGWMKRMWFGSRRWGIGL